MQKYTEKQLKVLNSILKESNLNDLDKSVLLYSRMIVKRVLSDKMTIKTNHEQLPEILICFEEFPGVFYAPFEPLELKEYIDKESGTINSCYETKE